MPSELRFCRNCGYRLGEGSAEYTETIPFPNGRPMPPFANGAKGFPGTAGAMSPAAARQLKRRKKGFGGISWIFIAVILFFVVGGVASLFAPKFQRVTRNVTGLASRASYLGVSGFETTDGGVTFDDVEPPGGPADKAGLVGGDVITTFDGHRIFSDEEMMGRLAETPIGKTVDVIFTRDGETKTTTLTTVSKGDFDQLVSAFRHRPEGQGVLGVSDQTVVAVPEAKLRGVRLKVDPSKAAAIAGLKDGDIVIAFDKIPIRTEGEFASRIHRAIPYSTVMLVVMRGNERLEIPVKMGKR